MKTFSEFLNERLNENVMGYIGELGPNRFEAYIESVEGNPVKVSTKHSGKETHKEFKTREEAVKYLRKLNKKMKIQFTNKFGLTNEL